MLNGGAELGVLYANYTITEAATNCSVVATNPPQRISDDASGSVGNIQFSKIFNVTNQFGTGSDGFSFTGALSGDTVTGTANVSSSFTDVPNSSGAFNSYTYQASTPVTLQKQ